MMTTELEFTELPLGFKNLSLHDHGTGKFLVTGSATVNRTLYFFHLTAFVKDGKVKIEYSPRWETLTGKPVRSKANEILEELTDQAMEIIRNFTPHLAVDPRE